MTGCTVLAISNGKTFLFKVRHDGGNLAQHISNNKKPILTMPFQDLGKYLSNWWAQDCGQPISWPGGGTMDCEIQTIYKNGYYSPTNIPGTIASASDFDARVELMEEEIRTISDDGYLCGYTDYCIVINFDKQNIMKV
jgi:hypothetical protein